MRRRYQSSPTRVLSRKRHGQGESSIDAEKRHRNHNSFLSSPEQKMRPINHSSKIARSTSEERRKRKNHRASQPAKINLALAQGFRRSLVQYFTAHQTSPRTAKRKASERKKSKPEKACREEAQNLNEQPRHSCQPRNNPRQRGMRNERLRAFVVPSAH